jgi:hypothetical protein
MSIDGEVHVSTHRASDQLQDQFNVLEMIKI